MSHDVATMMDSINRKAWRQRDSVKHFEQLEGWTDPGEEADAASLAAEVTGEPILDLGVGAGRTVPWMRAMSEDYTALDYTIELVEACRRRFPGVRVVHGDARDLSMFQSGSFKLVAFSFNGIDAVNPEDRLRVMREVHRVLRPGGLFFFSAHNVRGPGHRQKLRLGLYPSRNPFKMAARSAHALLRAPRAISNYRRYGRLAMEREGYALANASAHDHGIVIHYISLEHQRLQLQSAGFQTGARVYGNIDGRPLPEAADTCDVWWFHFLARKA